MRPRVQVNRRLRDDMWSTSATECGAYTYQRACAKEKICDQDFASSCTLALCRASLVSVTRAMHANGCGAPACLTRGWFPAFAPIASTVALPPDFPPTPSAVLHDHNAPAMSSSFERIASETLEEVCAPKPSLLKPNDIDGNIAGDQRDLVRLAREHYLTPSRGEPWSCLDFE
jgi:hypothetical protein